MKKIRSKTIQVTVDKSHLLTLGEKMYVESIELARELVNNAYDADATDVYVNINSEKIVIEDNGSGMNEKGLAQYFNIGSPEKKIRNVSPRFGRKRIGQFGIGKFAALAAADQFVVETRKGNWIYTVTFNKKDWQTNESWDIPIRRERATPFHNEGTKVTLSDLKRKFKVADIERYLKESIPIRAKKFNVYLNNKKITPRYIPGRRIPIQLDTLYGAIEGEIIIVPYARLITEPGVECRVKEVLVKRELFDLDPRQHGIQRITGYVNADFLPFTSARTDFIKDSPEYQLFRKIMKTALEKVVKELRKEMESKSLKKMGKALKDVLEKIREALKSNPDLTPSGRMMARRKKEAAASAEAKSVSVKGARKEEEQPREKKEIKIEQQEKPETTVIKRFRIKKLGFTCAFAYLGEDGPEAYSVGNIIYINQDHPLYKKLYSQKELLSLHLLRLITQEIVMMKRIRLPAKDAFQLQSRLLTDSLVKR